MTIPTYATDKLIAHLYGGGLAIIVRETKSCSTKKALHVSLWTASVVLERHWMDKFQLEKAPISGEMPMEKVQRSILEVRARSLSTSPQLEQALLALETSRH